MNHLVFLDAQAGELEKILSGVKTMLAKEYDPLQFAAHPVCPGDSLYFLRGRDECALRVKATVVRVIPYLNGLVDDLSPTLKEMQPRLQFTEAQYNHWAAKKQYYLVEFCGAQKIAVIQVSPDKIPDRSSWIAFEEFAQINS